MSTSQWRFDPRAPSQLPASQGWKGSAEKPTRSFSSSLFWRLRGTLGSAANNAVTHRGYSLVFAFRFGYRIGRTAGDLHPEVVSISPSQSRILIVSEGPGPPNGPVALTSPPPRAANCLWLWHCKKHNDEGE